MIFADITHLSKKDIARIPMAMKLAPCDSQYGAHSWIKDGEGYKCPWCHKGESTLPDFPPPPPKPKTEPPPEEKYQPGALSSGMKGILRQWSKSNAVSSDPNEWKAYAESETGVHKVNRPCSRRRRNLIKLIIARGDPIECCWCTKPLTDRTVTLEHLKRLADGGTNDLDNLALACAKCNHTRHKHGMKDRTLWTDREAKFKPRNKQAAMLIRPSLEIFFPPPEPPAPKAPAPDPVKAARGVLAAAQKKAAALKAESEARAKENARLAREKQHAQKNAKGFQCKWAVKNARRLAKISGKPKPTPAELEAIRLKIPWVGQSFQSKQA